MSISTIVRLDDVRSRRLQRLRESAALYGGDEERSRIVPILERILRLADGDRAATLWLDEYGPGVVHVHCIVDLAACPPRRTFDREPLHAAWEEGVPGILDAPALPSRREAGSGLPGLGSRAVVSLGSDGARSWFVSVDSLRPRASLTSVERGELMFLAGEVCSILLHRDLPLGRSSAAPLSDFERRRRESFGAWPILRDIEGRESDDEANRRISARFLVARLVRGLLEEEFAVEEEAIRYRAAGVLRELAALPDQDEERRHWECVVRHVEEGAIGPLTRSLVELGNLVERQGHLYGAREFFRTAYEVAVVGGDTRDTADAARFHARSCRKLGDLQESVRWYETALGIVRATGDDGRVAVILSGLANTLREGGDAARARELTWEGVELANRLSDRYVSASFYHTLLALDKAEGKWSEAIANGWQAFGLYPEAYHQTLVLMDLAGVFLATGSFRSAEDAYTVVQKLEPDHPVATLAAAGLIHSAALQGDETLFQERWSELQATDWRALPQSHRLQVELYVGKSLAALGRDGEARLWLEQAQAQAKLAGLLQVVEEAAEALAPMGLPRMGRLELDERAGRVIRELRQVRQRITRAG